jgi:C1A family cysteine protease
MDIEMIPGMGWLPDIPSLKDYTDEHPDVVELLNRTAAPRMAAAVGLAPARVVSSGAGRGTGAAAAMAPAAVVGPTVDLRAYFSPIEDQGQLGSCTANAAVGLLEYFERRAFGHHIDASRLFVYKVTRHLLGWTGDTGAYIRTAMEALACFGAPPERYWKYDGRSAAQNTLFDVEPSAFCYAFANNYEALKYYRLDPNGVSTQFVLDNVRAHLASGLPVMFGFPVYTEFMFPPAGAKVAYPQPNSKYYGGHAIIAAGFDDNLMIGADKGALLIRNSWGNTWGDHGYAWLSYRYITAGLAVDWWTLIRAKWVDTGAFA